MRQEDGHVEVGVYLIAAAGILLAVWLFAANGYIGIFSLWGVMGAGFLVYDAIVTTRARRRQHRLANPSPDDRLAAAREAAKQEEEKARAKRLAILKGDADPED